jgi:hypothetical protein
VSEEVARQKTRRRTARRLAKNSPLLACVPLFPLAEEYEVSLFLPIFTLSFGLAMVWLIYLFGWVVLGGLSLQIALVILG